MLKAALFYMIGDGAIVSFFLPHRGAFGSSSVPAPGICHPRQTKEILMPEG